MDNVKSNEGKELAIEVAGKRYARYPIRTETIMPTDVIGVVIEKYVRPHIKMGDTLFISERIIAIMQGRAYPIDEIKPSWLAKLLVRFVHKSPYGIGLGSPWTMELAIREAGAPLMLIGALASVLTKPLGMRGVFYRVVGHNINAIDGPCDNTVPPFNKYAKLGPLNPDKVAGDIRQQLGIEVVIIDANDLGVNVLGRSSESISKSWCEQVFRDNPLGQSSERTPLCLVEEIESHDESGLPANLEH